MCSASGRLLHHFNFWKGPTLVHCIQRFLASFFARNFRFCFYFPLVRLLLTQVPVGDYYVFDNGKNGLCDGDGAKLNEKKKISIYRWCDRFPNLNSGQLYRLISVRGAERRFLLPDSFISCKNASSLISSILEM